MEINYGPCYLVVNHIHRHTLCYLVYELSDPDNLVDHLREVPANEWPRLVSRASMASALKVRLQA